jgi:hypothetical protein
VRQALQRLASLDPSFPGVRDLRASFEHRLCRLEHKLRGERWY